MKAELKVEPKIRNRILKIIMISIAVFGFQAIFSGPSSILTPFAVSLGATTAIAGLAFGIINLVRAITMVIFGIAVDKYGRKRFIFLACLLLTLGTFLCPFAMDPTQLILYRAVAGLGAGGAGLFGAAFAILFSREKSSLAMGVFMSLSGIAGFVGSLLSGIILGSYGFFMVFMVLAAIGIIATIASPFGVQELPKRTVDPNRPKGRSFLQILTTRNVGLAFLANFLITIGIQTTIGFSPLMAFNIGATAATVGLLVGLIVLPMAIMGVPIGALASKIGNKKIAIFGFILIAITMILVAYAYTTGSVLFLTISALAFGIAMGFVTVPVLGLVVSATPPEEHGRAISLIMASVAAPGVLTVVTGYLVQIMGYLNMFTIMAVLVFIGAVALIFTREKKREPAPPVAK